MSTTTISEKDIQTFLQRPIIVFASMSEISAEIKAQILEARKKQLTEVNGDITTINQLTDYEIAIYFMTASAVAPLTAEATKLYMNCFAKVYPEATEATDVYDKNDLTLTDYEKYQLNELKVKLFKQSIKKRKDRI